MLWYHDAEFVINDLFPVSFISFHMPFLSTVQNSFFLSSSLLFSPGRQALRFDFKQPFFEITEPAIADCAKTVACRKLAE